MDTQPRTVIALTTRLGLTLDVMLVPASRVNMPTRTASGKLDYVPLVAVKKVTIHETDNTSAGANALMHRNFVAGGGGTKHVSFTYTVDDRRAIQILPEGVQQWAQGDDVGNTTSVSIETCVNRDGDKARTRDNLAKLTAAYLLAHDLSLSAVVQHNVWYGKDCPHQLRAEPGAWAALLAKIADYVQQLKTPDAPPAPTPEVKRIMNGFTVAGAFLDFWLKQGGLAIFGYPISAEHQQDFPGVGTLPVQDFERARFELHGDTVILGRVNAELLQLKEAA